MRSHLECWPCFLEQALRAARLAGLGDEDTLRVLNQVGSRLADFDPADPPPKHGRYLYRTIAELSRKPDPYAEVKHRHTATALALLPRLRRFAGAAPDPLDAAMRIAAAGNTLDLGAQPQTGDLEQALRWWRELKELAADPVEYQKQISRLEKLLGGQPQP